MSDNSGEQLIDEPDVALFDDLLSSTRSTEDRQAAVGACLAFADAKKDEMRKYNASQLVLTGGAHVSASYEGKPHYTLEGFDPSGEYTLHAHVDSNDPTKGECKPPDQKAKTRHQKRKERGRYEKVWKPPKNGEASGLATGTSPASWSANALSAFCVDDWIFSIR